MDLFELRQVLEDSFNLEELQTLCFDLGINYENLGVDTLQSATRELVAHCQRQNRIPDLIDQIQKLRPNVASMPTKQLSSIEEKSPFKGLQFYDVDDAHLFFGRTKLIDKLEKRINRLRVEKETRFLAIVGASGSGKSSLVRAGLIPQIQKTGTWKIHIVRPRSHPLMELAYACAEEENVVANTLSANMCKDLYSLRAFCRETLKPDQNLLLFIDQFEELFTLCDSETDRAAFVENLFHATTPYPDDSVIIVLITLRADFYHRCAEHPTLRQMLAENQEYIGSMVEEELCEVITEPVKQVGWKYEANLIELILKDAGNEPGNLALLSHALNESWKESNKNIKTITHVDYQKSGGVRGAISKSAQETFTQLDRFQQQVARNIFLHLTELGEGTEGTRRRVKKNELITSPEMADDVNEVLRVLIESRLITIDKESIEIAHEALIREWNILRLWLEEDREILLTHRRLNTVAQIWFESDKDQDLLFRGNQLAALQAFSAQYYDRLTQQEREFLEAGYQAEEDRRKRKQEDRENAKRIFKWRWIGLCTIAPIIGVFIFILPVEILIILIFENVNPVFMVASLVLAFAGTGATIGLIQWFALKEHLDNARQWILSSMLGWSVGVIFTVGIGGILTPIALRVLSSIGVNPQTFATIAAITSLIGIGVLAGTMQLFVLRKQIGGWWILAAAIGNLILIAIGTLSFGADNAQNVLVVAGIFITSAFMMGSVIGLLQWTTLRKKVAMAKWWILLSALSISLSFFTCGLIYGILTGPVLYWLLTSKAAD